MPLRLEAPEATFLQVVGPMLAGEEVPGLNVEAVEGRISESGSIGLRRHEFALSMEAACVERRLDGHEIDRIGVERAGVDETRREMGFRTPGGKRNAASPRSF